jgi:ZIP family zinc transporter
MNWFHNLSPIVQALLASVGTWGTTSLGAALVVFAKKSTQKLLDACLGMASGIMIAASFWSLLEPAVRLSARMYGDCYKWIPPIAGFLLGAAVLRVIDRLLPHLHPDLAVAEGPKTSWHRSTLMVLAITLHNIPEGLAVGIAFGSAANLLGAERIAQVGTAIGLAIGIALQDFPEGAAVALPLRREGFSRRRAFCYGMLSGLVEPIAAVAGAWMVVAFTALLPYGQGFAAGAMIFIVVEELIPESQRHGHVDLATMGAILGFALMMALDVALG